MKKYYVNGGILVKTPFFVCLEGGAGYKKEDAPGSIDLPTNRKLPSREKYLLIDDDHPQSMFAKYYANSFFTTGYCGAPLFYKDYQAGYSEFCDRVEDARLLMKLGAQNKESAAVGLLSRQAFFTVLSALDTFFADMVLTRLINNEEAFYSYAEKKEICKGDHRNNNSRKNGLIEKRVIEHILKTPFLKKEVLDEVFPELFGFQVEVDAEMKELFHQRHRIAHRGGRMKDGSFVRYSGAEIEKTISRVDGFAADILKKILNREKQSVPQSV